MNETRAPIVVGVDDTQAARAALVFAMREASRRGSTLDVVTAWTAEPSLDPSGADKTEDGGRARAQEAQDGAVAAVLREFDGSPVLSRQVVEGEAASVLLSTARTAAYLVLGAGRGRSATSPLGSVGERCLRQARCPVLVVPLPSAAGTRISHQEGTR